MSLEKRSGELGRFSFFPKGALTHHLRSRRWYPSLWSGSCALRGGFRFLRKPMDDAGKLLSSTQQARDGTKCSILACCLRKPATGSFAADMGASICRCTHLLFCERETEIEERTVKGNGNLPFGSEGCEPWHRAKCRSCRSLYELQRDL